MEQPDQQPDRAQLDRYRELLAARSNFRFFGSTAIFVDQTNLELVEISPEAIAAKAVADLAMLPDFGTRSDQRRQMIDPVRRLITPLISGETPWATDSMTPESMFVAMLSWLTGNRPLGLVCAPARPGENSLVPAVFLTLDVLLDGADIRQALDRSVKLNLPLMFRCLCHLLMTVPGPEQGADHQIDGPADLRKTLFGENLRRLQADGIARLQPDDEACLNLH